MGLESCLGDSFFNACQISWSVVVESLPPLYPITHGRESLV